MSHDPQHGLSRPEPIMPPEDTTHHGERVLTPENPVPAPDIVMPPDTPTDPVTSSRDTVMTPEGNAGAANPILPPDQPPSVAILPPD
jgi:hypothetical protein